MAEKITHEYLTRIFTEAVGELKTEVASFGEQFAELLPEKINEDWEEWSEKTLARAFKLDSSDIAIEPILMAITLELVRVIAKVIYAILIFILELITTIVLAISVQPWFGILLAPLGLISVVAPNWVKKRASNKLRDGIHKKLGESLQSKIPGIQRDIRLKTREQLQPYFDNLNRILQENIEREKERLHRVTELKSAGEAEVAAEIARLETIETGLAAQFEAIHCDIYPGLTPAIVKEETKN